MGKRAAIRVMHHFEIESRVRKKVSHCLANCIYSIEEVQLPCGIPNLGVKDRITGIHLELPKISDCSTSDREIITSRCIDATRKCNISKSD